jgi:hypothetical protein
VTPASSTVVQTYSGERPPWTMLLQATSIPDGFAADTDAGAKAAVASIAAAESKPAVRTKVPRRARRVEREVVIAWSPSYVTVEEPVPGDPGAVAWTAPPSCRTG